MRHKKAGKCLRKVPFHGKEEAGNLMDKREGTGGMKMSELFFGVLKILEKSSADGALSDQAASLLRRLTGFVEGGSFTKSKTDQFILENFRLSSAEMTGKWNALHPDRKKLDSTFRGQVSVLSHYLYSMFSTAPDELLEGFLNNEKGVVRRMSEFLDASALEEFHIADRFPAVTQSGFLPAYTTDSGYDMKDCIKEIQLLKSLECSTIQKMLEKIDMDRLVYVMQTIREPLVTDIRVKIAGKKKKVKTARVNHGKLEFCKVYGMVKAKQPEPAPDRKVLHQDSGVAASGPEETPYHPESGRTLRDILMQRSKDRMTEEETVRWLEMTEAQRNEEKKRLVRLLMVFTEEGLRRQLKRYSPLTVQEVLDRDYPAELEKAACLFKKA